MLMCVLAEASSIIVVIAFATTTVAPVQYKTRAVIAAGFIDARLSKARWIYWKIGTPHAYSMSAMISRMDKMTKKVRRSSSIMAGPLSLIIWLRNTFNSIFG